jgi:hypothetical protein
MMMMMMASSWFTYRSALSSFFSSYRLRDSVIFSIRPIESKTLENMMEGNQRPFMLASNIDAQKRQVECCLLFNQASEHFR